MAAIVRVEVLDPRTSTRTSKRRFDARTRRTVLFVVAFGPLVRQPVRTPENFFLPLRKCHEGIHYALRQRNATGFSVFRFQEDDMTALQVYLAPIEPQRLPDAGAGIDQEDHERSKMISAGIN